MGQTLPTIAVKRFTGIEQDQIKQTYGVLCQRSGTTKINQPSFTEYWTDYVDPSIASRLWIIFDTKFDGFLDFEEWATGLSTTLRGNKEERYKLLGNIFDIDGHGYVIEDNLRKLFATNLFAARNVIKPFDWERYEASQAAANKQQEGEFVKALYDYTATNHLELSLKEGDVLRLLERVDSDWWWCETKEEVAGYVPTTYVELMQTAPTQLKGKQSKFQTVKRGTEVEVLLSSLLKLGNKDLGGKIPKDLFLQWALEHDMDKCFDPLEKFDLRPPAVSTVKSSTSSSSGGSNSATRPTSMTKEPISPRALTSPAPKGAAPLPSVTTTPSSTISSTTASTNTTDSNSSATDLPDLGPIHIRPMSEALPRITPELATILKAAGVADKELDDEPMMAFINYFIDKHAPAETGKAARKTVGGAAARRRANASGATALKRRPLPTPDSENTSTTTSTTDSATSEVRRAESTPLLEQIRAGKKLKASQKRTQRLATLSKKDLTGLGLLLRTQIDSRRNFIVGSDDDESDSYDSDFDD